MINFKHYKRVRKLTFVAKQLQDMIGVFDMFEQKLGIYRFYVPAQDVITNLRTNRNFAKLSLKRIEEELKELDESSEK